MEKEILHIGYCGEGGIGWKVEKRGWGWICRLMGESGSSSGRHVPISRPSRQTLRRRGVDVMYFQLDPANKQ